MAQNHLSFVPKGMSTSALRLRLQTHLQKLGLYEGETLHNFRRGDAQVGNHVAIQYTAQVRDEVCQALGPSAASLLPDPVEVGLRVSGSVGQISTPRVVAHYLHPTSHERKRRRVLKS